MNLHGVVLYLTLPCNENVTGYYVSVPLQASFSDPN